MSITRLMTAKVIITQNRATLIKYGVISLTKPPAREKATVDNATPFARLARGKISVGYTKLMVQSLFSIINKH